MSNKYTNKNKYRGSRIPTLMKDWKLPTANQQLQREELGYSLTATPVEGIKFTLMLKEGNEFRYCNEDEKSLWILTDVFLFSVDKYWELTLEQNGSLPDGYYFICHCGVDTNGDVFWVKTGNYLGSTWKEAAEALETRGLVTLSTHPLNP